MKVIFKGSNMLIKNNHDRQKIRQEKVNKILLFLKQETYTDMRAIMIILNYKSRPPAYRLLRQMVSLGLLIKYEFPLPIGKLSLWGITMDGLSEVYTENDPLPPIFKPNKLILRKLQRHLDSQNIKLDKNDF